MPLPESVEPEPAKAADQLAEYDLGDHSFDPELDGAPAPAAKAAPPKDPETGRFVPKAKHSPLISRLARDMGLTAEEIEAADPADLNTYINARTAAHRDAPRTVAPHQAEEPAKPTAPAELTVEDLPAEIAEQLEPAVAQHIKQLTDAVRRLLASDKSHTSAIGQLGEFVRPIAEERAFSEVDKGFADLGPAYEAVLGKGQRADFKDGDPALMLRAMVAQSLQQAPIKGVSVRVAVKQRAEQLFGHLASAAVAPERPVNANGRQEIHDSRVAAWANGKTARPTHREAVPGPKGEKRAAVAVGRRMADLGLTDEGIEEQGVPE